MATHSNILAWRIPWTEEPGGLQSTRRSSEGQEHAYSGTLSRAAFTISSSSLMVTPPSPPQSPVHPTGVGVSVSVGVGVSTSVAGGVGVADEVGVAVVVRVEV